MDYLNHYLIQAFSKVVVIHEYISQSNHYGSLTSNSTLEYIELFNLGEKAEGQYFPWCVPIADTLGE
jgi:hypothetical protein